MWERVFFVIAIFSGPLYFNVCANSTHTGTDIVTQTPITTTTLSTPSTPAPSTTDRPRFEPIVMNGEDGKVYNKTVDSSVEYIFLFNFKDYRREGEMKNEDIRVHVEVGQSYINYPVTFVVKQRKSSLSWQLPVLSKFDRKVYQSASRTLCIENDFALHKANRSASDLNYEEDRMIVVSVSTSSPVKVPFSVNVSRENNFVMSLNKAEIVDVSPLSPRFFEFIFPHSNSRFVLLEVKSNDTSCMTVSVQNASCPILDQENNVQFEGYWQTMSKKAGMTLRKEDFPNGFYVVFVMHGDDTRCKRSDDSGGGAQPLLYASAHGSNNDRTKIVEFVIHEKISDIEYLAAIFGTSGLFALFYVFVFIISCTYSCRSSRSTPLNENGIDNQPSCSRDELPENEPISDTTPIIYQPTNQPHTSTVLPNDGVDDECDDNDSRHWLENDSSLDETDIDFMDDANREKDVYRTTQRLCVAALAKKNSRVLAKKSQLYLYTLFTVAVFYGLPVVQLVFTYQKVLHTTGNQDLCYYNYLCSHPLWLLSDFNHVYSNIGYIMLGLLFLVLVLRKERIHERLCKQDKQIELKFGIPRHFGLFYAMGFALCMEGALSACYHVCPNHSNFQFDTCFMYVNAILCMLKIYQTRHPDINASAYMAFTSLAFVVLLGVVGVMAGNLYFWITFTTFHVLFCIFMTVQIYYLGRWKLDCGVFQRIYQTWKNDCIASPLLCLKPLYLDRMVLLTIANICNWSIAGYGMWKMPQDFASHLLLIFMSNLFLYSNFYIIMKLTHREKITCQPAIYILLSIVFWGLSMFVFLQKSTSWQLSPAESRTFNKECMLLGFYDTHDIWHFLSAFSMFFSFMILLTLDDDLILVPRTEIPVF